MLKRLPKLPKPLLYFVVFAVIACIAYYAMPKGSAFTIPGIGITISKKTEKSDTNTDTNTNNNNTNNNNNGHEENPDNTNTNNSGNAAPHTPDDIDETVISRAEFAKELNKIFIYTVKDEISLPDIEGSDAEEEIKALVGAGVMTTYQDNTFRPNQPITRGEAISALIKAARLDILLVDVTDLQFEDITSDNIYVQYIKLAEDLTLLPWEGTKLSPEKAVLHKESNYMLEALKTLKSVKGTVARLDLDNNRLVISNDNIANESINVQSDTVVFKNAVLSSIDDLKANDNIVAITTADGTARHITAAAEIPESIISELENLLDYFLSPDQVKSLVAGDYNTAREKVEKELETQLQHYGFEELEINSLLEQDWDSLKSQGKERITNTLAQSLQVPKEVIDVALQQDWNKLLAFAQVHLAEQAINELLQNS